jgi:predicted acetyltransferase
VDITIRRGRPEDHPAILELDSASFGADYGEQEAADARAEVPPEQFLLAVDDADGRVVGVTADLDLAVTVPGGADVPVSGVTWVAVDITHRRRGILRALLERQLREHAESGSVASGLLAAEAGIYGRFGFGMATRFRTTTFDRPRSALARRVDASQVRRLATDAARDRLPDIHERWRRCTPGAVRRTDAMWHGFLLDRPSDREGWSGLHHLVHPDGYLSYRLKQNWSTGDPQTACRIVDYAPATEQAHAALWQTVLAMDLVTQIESDELPLDDPLPWLLTDPRKLRTTMVRDGLFLRPLDVARLLSARSYAVEVEAVIRVSDPLLGDGCYRLLAGPDGATCTRADGRTADIEMGVADLGAVSLGGTRLGELARAGLIDYADDAVLHRLDRALLADRAPAHGTSF